VLHKAYLEQIDVYYNLQDDLSITSPTGLQKGEKFFEQCKFFDILSYFTILMYINVRPTLNFTPTLPSLIPARQLTEIQDSSIPRSGNKPTVLQGPAAPPKSYAHMGKGPNCGVGGFYSGGIDEISGRREKYVICAGEDLILSQ
jgi:hypothetical protein